MHIDSLHYIHDLEEKPALTSRHTDSAIFFTCCHISTHEAQAQSLSKAAQTEVCRFTEEAISTQFLLIQKLGKELSHTCLLQAFSRVNEQVCYFLQRHAWQAHIHILVLLQHNAFTQANNDELTAITIGHPNIMGMPHKDRGLYFFQGGDFFPTSDSRFESFVGALGGNHDFDLQISSLKLNKFSPTRLIIGAPGLQQLQPSKLQAIFFDEWDVLDHTLIDSIQSSDYLDPPPFTCLQISQYQHWAFLFAALQKLKTTFFKFSFRKLEGNK